MTIDSDDEPYWREFDVAVRPMLGAVVLLAAACAAALTLGGAASASAQRLPHASCERCLLPAPSVAVSTARSALPPKAIPR